VLIEEEMPQENAKYLQRFKYLNDTLGHIFGDEI
jgi:hypothetical protein